MISHHEAQTLISARMDGPLDAAANRELQMHLAGCATCRRFAEQTGALARGLRALPQLPPSPNVNRLVLEHVSRDRSSWARFVQTLRLSTSPLAVAAIAVLLVAAVAFTVILRTDDEEPGTLNAPTDSAVLTAPPTSTPSPEATETAPPASTATTAPSATSAPTNTVAAPTPTATPVRPTATPQRPTVAPIPPNVTVPTVPPAEEPTPSATPAATEAPRPTETPEPTATEEPAPTETVEPTATATPEPTATETPTEEPTPTETPEPTATETPVPTDTPEPTATETPPATETPTPEPPTETPEPETPVAAPTIAPRSGTDVAGADVPTEEAVVEETPVEEAPTEDTTLAIETTEESPTPEQDGFGGGPLDLASAEVTLSLPPGSAPRDGPLLWTPQGDALAFFSDPDAASLAVADLASGGVVELGGPYRRPVWSPDGGWLLLDHYVGSDYPSIAVWNRYSGELIEITTQSEEEPVHFDVPAGWLGETVYYQRTYVDQPGVVELHRAAIDGSGDTVVWSAEGVSLVTTRPVQADGGFLIALARDGEGALWLFIDGDGNETPLGGVGAGGDISEAALSPGRSLIAYASGGQVVIESMDNLGVAMGYLPYSAEMGFAWSPDGERLVVSDGTSLAIYTNTGDLVTSFTNDTGALVGAPVWRDDGIWFLEGGTAAIRRIPPESF